MLHDPYRQMFLAGNAAGRLLSAPGRLGRQGELFFRKLDVPSGGRLLLAGMSDPRILPSLRLRLGLTGQLVILDPSSNRLAMVPRRDADWAVLLKAPATVIPNMDSSLDMVLCWGSFLDLDHHYLDMVAEFFRILSPGGRVLVAEPGRGAESSSTSICSTGMTKLFIEAGFSRIAFDESDDGYIFKAEKVAGFNASMSQAGRA